MPEESVPQSAPDHSQPEIDASGVDRQQIRNFLRLSVAERLSWLDDYTSSILELRKLNPHLGRR